MAGSHSHRSSFKASHKSFKSKHSSKSALKKINKGKVETSTSHNNNNKPMLNKQQRKNQAKQQREKKILSTTLKKKLFEGSNGVNKIVTIIPLTTDINPADILKQILLNGIGADFEMSTVNLSMPSVNTIKIDKFKKKIKFIIPNMHNILDVLDVCKVSDVIVFGLSSMQEVDPTYGEQILRSIELQGISNYLGVISNLSAINMKEKFQLDIKQSLESYFKHFFPNEKQLYNLEKVNESTNCLRSICEKLPNKVSWRDSRGYLVVDDLSNMQLDQSSNQLILQGHCRGSGFNADGLIHIPGHGDFQINKLEVLDAHHHREVKDMFASTENKEGLNEFNEDVDDDLDIEENDNKFEYDNLTTARFDDGGFLPNTDGMQSNKPEVRIPKGTSSYQARWYLDDVIDEDEESASEFEDEKENKDNMIDDEDDLYNNNHDDKDYNYVEHEDDEEFVDFSDDEEERQLLEYRNLEKEDREFPDEVELHPLEKARDVLHKYRGLKNLYNCSWDVDEFDDECPDEWFNILRIQNFKNTRKKIIKDFSKAASVKEGDYFRIYIDLGTRDSNAFMQKLQTSGATIISIFALLPHEHKQTVANFSIQRWEEYEAPIPSNESMVVQYGMRRYEIQPLFSGASVTPNNVHKYDRFLHHDSLSVATCIAPVDFTQAPAIFFKFDKEKFQNGNTDVTNIEFLGHGSFISSDHTRVLAKRIVLTGSPFKFHKNVITVRYMFFNSEDVEWFKSIPLFTNSGRSGFIKESLGTHGYFKATFDTKLSAQDVIGMSLYKRMWPELSKQWSPLE